MKAPNDLIEDQESRDAKRDLRIAKLAEAYHKLPVLQRHRIIKDMSELA